MISHQKKFIFVHIPRTGGTHLSNFLLPYCDEESLRFSSFGEDEHQHATLLDYVAYYGKEILDYTIFSIVRNPWDRALSLSLKIMMEFLIESILEKLYITHIGMIIILIVILITF